MNTLAVNLVTGWARRLSMRWGSKPAACVLCCFELGFLRRSAAFFAFPAAAPASAPPALSLAVASASSFPAACLNPCSRPCPASASAIPVALSSGTCGMCLSSSASSCHTVSSARPSCSGAASLSSLAPSCCCCPAVNALAGGPCDWLAALLLSSPGVRNPPAQSTIQSG